MIEYADPTKLPPPRAASVRATAQVAAIIGWILLAAVIGAAVGALARVTFTPLLGVLAGVGVVLYFIVTGRCLRVARERRATLLLSYLEQPVRLNLPLPQMLRAAAQSERGVVARQLDRLRSMIEDGSPIGDALGAAAPLVPRRVVELTIAAERNGRLPDMLARLLANERGAAARSRASEAFGGAYAAILAAAIALVLGFFAVFVMPKYVQIFKDFGLPLPPITRHVIGAAGTLAIPVMIVAVVALLWMIGRGMRDTFVTRPVFNPLSWFVERLAWCLPIVGTIARDRGLADACHVIADALEAGRPLDHAVLEADRPHLNPVLRARLSRWADALGAGAMPDAAARAARMPDIVVGLLASAQASDSVPETFRFLARYYESRFSRAMLMLRSFLVPGIALVAGAVVCATTLAIFLPIIRLIDNANPWPQVTP